MYDTLVRSVDTRPPSDGVVIVDIDEASLSTVGQWPWPRDVMGHLIAGLRRMGAATVALDIIFAETDRFGLVGDRKAAPVTPDDLLARTLRDGRVILGYGLTFDSVPRTQNRCVLHPIGLAVHHPRDETGETPYFQATGAVCSLPVLAEAAGASGFLNAAPDADGILRRVPLLAELDGRVYPGLALAAVTATRGARNLGAADLERQLRDARHRRHGGSGGRKEATSSCAIAGRSERFPTSRPPTCSTTAYLPRRCAARWCSSARRPSAHARSWRRRSTRSSPASRCRRPLPTTCSSRTSSGGRRLGSTVEALAALLLGVAVAALVATAGVVAGVLGAVLSLVGVWWGAAWVLSTSGLFFSPLAPTLTIFAGLAIMTFAKFTVEHGRAESAGRERTAAQRLMVQTLLSLTETRDAETGRHSRRTQLYARLLAEQLAVHPDYHAYLTPERIDLLSSLAPLHDIGKVGIPDHILNKPGPLTQDELAEMRKHPVLGRDVILRAEQQVGVRDDATLALAKDIVYTHHERWDGTGYPQGLRGPQIPVAGRVMAIVDVYDAIVSRTLYRATMSHDEAVTFIVGGKGTHFDPAVVDAFLRVAPALASVGEEAIAVDHR